MNKSALVEAVYLSMLTGEKYTECFSSYSEFLNYTETVYSDEVYMIQYQTRKMKTSHRR